jgi:hypothetical protein
MNEDPLVYHVQLRQFPNLARAFNLSRAELDERFLGPLVRDQLIELDDRRWAPERVKLLVYEGRRLRPEEIGMGRGWGNATRHGTDVTEWLLAEARTATAPAPALKDAIVDRCRSGPVGLQQLRELAPDGDVEEAVVALLRAGKLRLTV